MYLAREIINGTLHYFIRESFETNGDFHSRDLLCLGTRPGKYIIYPGRNSFYIDEQILDNLNGQGMKVDYDELENLFLPFLKLKIKYDFEHYASQENQGPISKLSKTDEKRIRSSVHLFDKMRLHYLKFSSVNQGMIRRANQKCFFVLLDKSRDEIEQLIMEMEGGLRLDQLKYYVYVVFDLQKFFSQAYATVIPQALDQEKVDKYFLEELCRLNRDQYFWKNSLENNFLHRYLMRYVVMFFDNKYGPSPFNDNYIHDFMDSRRYFKYPESQGSMKSEEVSAAFDMKKEELWQLSERQLIKLYRKKAKELHPDVGGDHDKFVRLTEAFNTLLLTKKK